MKTASVPKNISAQIERLREEIRGHDRLYYVLSSPKISDTEYDMLLRRLSELEGRYPETVTPTSPTQRVSGAISTDFKPVTHTAPMLSLDNVYNEDEFRKWHERILGLLPAAQTPRVVFPA